MGLAPLSCLPQGWLTCVPSTRASPTICPGKMETCSSKCCSQQGSGSENLRLQGAKEQSISPVTGYLMAEGWQGQLSLTLSSGLAPCSFQPGLRQGILLSQVLQPVRGRATSPPCLRWQGARRWGPSPPEPAHSRGWQSQLSFPHAQSLLTCTLPPGPVLLC